MSLKFMREYRRIYCRMHLSLGSAFSLPHSNQKTGHDPAFTPRFICKIGRIMHMTEITDEDRERVKLLQLVTGSKHEFKKLTLEQLKRLQELVEKKDYGPDKKTHKSKVQLLRKINVRIYELTEGKGIWN